VALFTAGVPVWQRLSADGQVKDLPYAELSIYERWLHGGAWMALETSAIWLGHLLGGAGRAYVLGEGQSLLAYAEAFVNHEPSPLGDHLHLACLRRAAGCSDAHLLALADAILDDARALGKLSVGYPVYDKERALLCRQYFGMTEVMKVSRYTVSAQPVQSFYRSHESSGQDTKIEGWALAVGRFSSPRALWEREWVEHWHGLPQLLQRKKQRYLVNAGGHKALVCYHQQAYFERKAELYCWSPRRLSVQLLLALRDLGHRLGYRSLVLALPAGSEDFLPGDATVDPNAQVIASVEL